MKAVVYKRPFEVAVEEVPKPTIANPTDAILRLTSAALCGSDLHMYEGHTVAGPGIVFGHEPLGVIEEVGDAVVSIRPGDRVVLPFNISCGFCYNCVRGLYNACLTTNPENAGAAYGYVGMGPHRGAQAEYLGVPFADFNCLKLPGEPGDQWEDDFVLLADIFPTGFHATVLANVQVGSTVAVCGAGPVGLLAAYSALLRGASEVYVVDHIADRLETARQIGATPVDFARGDPVEQILEIRRDNRALREMMRPGDEKMAGVMCGIDAVGYQALDREDPSRQKPNQVLEGLARLVNPTGSIGVIGVYLTEDPRGPTDEAKRGEITHSFGKIWEKGIRIGTGQTPVKDYQMFLRDLIVAGRARPGFVVTQDLPLWTAPEAYRLFDKRAKGYTKVIFKPEIPMAA